MNKYIKLKENITKCIVIDKMEAETWILPELWREIKTYLFHNIKTQGKHLKKDMRIKNYNKVVESIPRKCIPRHGPKIIYNSATKSFRVAKFCYKVRFAPDKYIFILEYVASPRHLNETVARIMDEEYKRGVLIS